VRRRLTAIPDGSQDLPVSAKEDIERILRDATAEERPDDAAANLENVETGRSLVLGLRARSNSNDWPEYETMTSVEALDTPEEHGMIDTSRSASKPKVGGVVNIIPNHCCVVSTMVDEVYGVRNGAVEVVRPVAARGGAR
jgi:hypothetical protein